MRIERYVFARWKLALLAGAFVACSVSALLAAPAENLLVWWSFDQVQNGRTLERVALIEDVVGGNYKQPPGVVGKALQFDGFTTEIVRQAAVATHVPASFTLEAWVALGAYPWNWCPLIEQCRGTNAGYSLAIGPRGQVRLGLAVSGQWRECVSKDFVLPLRQWAHVAATFERSKGLTVFVNGEPAAFAADQGEPSSDLVERGLRLSVPTENEIAGHDVEGRDRAGQKRGLELDLRLCAKGGREPGQDHGCGREEDQASASECHIALRWGRSTRRRVRPILTQSPSAANAAYSVYGPTIT